MVILLEALHILWRLSETSRLSTLSGSLKKTKTKSERGKLKPGNKAEIFVPQALVLNVCDSAEHFARALDRT